MKKNILVVYSIILSIVMVVFSIINYTYSAKASISYDNVTYEKAKKMVQEVMKAYYVRGPRIQYNNAKATYGVVSPEEVTSQETKYDVCAAFICDVYTEAFGVTCDSSKFPLYNGHSVDQARDYYARLLNDSSLSDGKFLIYYQNNVAIDGYFNGSERKYVYNPSSSMTDITDRALFENFIKVLQPGDIFFYTGHVMMVYDIVYKNGVATDVLLMHATQQPFIKSRSTTTSRLSYNVFKSNIKSNILDIEAEGGIQWAKLSELTDKFFTTSETTGNRYLKCVDEDECAVIRPYYNNNGKVNFNYDVAEEKIKKSDLRTQYPSLFIEKIVNVGDNDSVHVGDKLTYEIKITNNSSTDYNSFVIKEEYSSMVTLVNSSVSEGAMLDSSNRIIKWNINKLDNGSSITLKYSVNVDNNLANVNKIVTENGVFYKNDSTSSVTIGTGTIKNKIVPKVNNLLLKNKTFSGCYESYSSSGLELIDDIYSCATGKKFNFATDFKFGDYISGTTRKIENGLFNNEKASSRTAKDVINFKGYSKTEIFKNMILNNYWSGMSYVDDKVDQVRWAGSDAGLRARTIKSEDFKEGDVLIYSINYNWGKLDPSLKFTDENGIYAYIYIGGKFIGKNGNGDSDIYVDGEFVGRKDTKDSDRDVFSYKYYRIVNDKGEYSSNKYSTNLYSGYDIDAMESSERGKILTYANYQTLFDKDYYVILRPEMVIKEAVSMKIVGMPDKIKYVYGEDLDLENGKFKIRYNDGTYSEEIDMKANGVTVSGFDKNSIGTQTVRITYNGVSASFNVEVKMEDLFEDGISVAVNGTTKVIYDIEEGTKISDLKSKINVSNITVTDFADALVDDSNDVIRTGYKLKINTVNGEEHVYILSVKGDINGDGNVNRIDLELSSEHIIDVKIIVNLAQLYAANMDNDSNIDITTTEVIDINDVIKLTRIAKKTIQS